MTMISHKLVSFIVLLFPVTELVIGVSKRASQKDSSVQDQGSLRVLLAVIAVSVVAGFGLKNVHSMRLPMPSEFTDALSAILTVAGMTLRWVSIRTLGRFFTVNIAIRHDQYVVTSGPYRFIRHPSYSGLLSAFLGLGLYLANWLSLLVIIIPIAWATLNRIDKEEEALLAGLGPPYKAYCDKTKRLIPWLY
jgi:protein-S-isoprenylcysteine O-methyltransferase